MSKRFKPSADIAPIKTLAEADSTLARIAALKRRLTTLELSMQEDIATVKLKAEAEAEPYRQSILDLETALATYATQNKESLFTDKVRSRALSFGTIGYRASSSLDTIGKTSWKEVLTKLEDSGLNDYIRQVPDVDKERLKKAPADILKKVRCVVRDKDEFFYELEEGELGDHTGEAA